MTRNIFSTCSKAELTLHKRRIHEGFSHSTRPKAFACTHCDFRSATKKIRDNHIKIRHLGIKDVHCPLCEKMFPTQQYMTQHLTKVDNSLQ